MLYFIYKQICLNISIDELFGYSLEENYATEKEYMNQYNDYQIKGNVSECINLMKRAIEEFPRNFEFMVCLAESFISYNATEEMIKYSNEHGYHEEAISLCERVIRDCNKDTIRQKAIQILCKIYPQVGKQSNALSFAIEMPSFHMAQEILLADILDGDKKIEQIQKNIIMAIDYSANAIVRQAVQKPMGMHLTNNEKIKLIETANALYYSIFYDGNLGLYHSRLAWNYRRLAELWVGEGMYNKAIEYLKKAKIEAKNYDSLLCIWNKKKYSALCVNKCYIENTGAQKNWEGTETEMLYYRTTESVFDEIRDFDEFVELQERIRKNNN